MNDKVPTNTIVKKGQLNSIIWTWPFNYGRDLGIVDLLVALEEKYNKANIGLYRDDGLAALKNITDSQAERTKKDIFKTFASFNLKIHHRIHQGDGNCQATSSVIYKATVKEENEDTKCYYGLTESTFKSRYTNHRYSFNHKKHANSTELSKHVWKLKQGGRPFTISWSIVTRANETKRRNLCLAEKLCINNANKNGLLNKRFVIGNIKYLLVTVGTVFLCLYLVAVVDCIRNPVRLIKHGYGDVLIAIHESIPEDHLIVDRLKNIFKSASSHLHTATRRWTYFQNVTILIPKTWSDNLREAPATTERFDKANFVVDQPNPEYGDNPYTRQTRGCGEPGDFVHFTERWVTDEQYSWYYWGDPGKVTVHEWAHLRWGVFNEYPEDDDQHFYYDQNGRVEPTRCSESIVGESRDIHNNYVRCNTDPDSGVMPEPGCRFFPDLKGNDAPASLMYANYLDSVINFCHSDDENTAGPAKHNRLARNKHNKQCFYQSIWDIMLKHDDFQDGKTPFKEPLDTTPNFLVMQEVDLRIVLVLDISGSMNSRNRLEAMVQASTKYIGYTVPNNTWIGIVEFSTSAAIRSYLVQVDNMETRKDLINLLPRSTGGSTCIGCGLRDGVEVLEHGGNTAAGGILFLVTDGGENKHPYIRDVVDELVEKAVVVNTLALSNGADDGLADLSEQTGGNSYWYSESPDSTALHDAYMDTILSRTAANVNTPVQLASYKTKVGRGDDYDNHVIIDSSIGRDTVFFIFWDLKRNQRVDVTITSPRGTIIDENSDNYLVDTRTHSIVIIIEGIAEPGHWLYHIKNTDSRDQVVEISIESKSASLTSDPLRLSSSSSSSLITESPPMIVIHADLLQGYQQVNNAKVTAIVERPSPYGAVELLLLDNGVGRHFVVHTIVLNEQNRLL
ncbi:calcium-activated chloride channel regulator 4A-like [Ptychodera flava]|uniref:calcium-activated chloride channel regulator 4A-like n=1 Tax=Ptychodera flava TaxID=63121 RepID=UPI003969BE67